MREGIKKVRSTAWVHLLLCIFGFVFIYPMIFTVLKSFMPRDDIFNPMVHLIPSKFTLDNYRVILDKIDLFKSVVNSVYLSGVSAFLQTLSCGLMGYGLSRFDFKLKKLYLLFIVISFIIPVPVLMIPTYLGYSELHLIDSPLAFFIPAILGQGLKSPIFILIFYSFFNTIPKALDEAAQIDGASAARIFFKVAVPLSIPACLLTFIFSVVWYWNETYLTALYLGDVAKTLPNQMAAVLNSLENEAIRNPQLSQLNGSVKMAASVLTLIPLLLFYVILQRQFVESIDRTGITGE